MELRRLRLLQELARRETIAAVAEALSFSPSSVSVQLAELEREAGVRLLRRVGRNVRLTPAGWKLAAYADQALAADEAIRADLSSVGDAPRGLLRMTFVQTPALALLPATMGALAQAAPDLRVEIVQRETAPALDDLRARAVDLVVGIDYDQVPTPRHRDLEREPLIREDVLLVVPFGYRADPGAALSLQEFADAPWAAGQPGTGHSAVVDHVCNRFGGFAPDIVHRTDDALILRALVSSARAVTLLPAFIATATPHVAAHPIREARLQRTIFSAARVAGAHSAAVLAARAALAHAARIAAYGRRDVALVAGAGAGPGA